MSEDYFSFVNQLFNSSKIWEKPEVLKGIRVLELTHAIFGPQVGRVLAQFGAEVIKVEEPWDGDLFRTATVWSRYWKHSNIMFHVMHANKYFVAINLKKEKGRELIKKLAKISDVVVENFRAGLAEAWGIGYTQLSKVNPKIIYLSCSGYGQWGPLRFFPSVDLVAQSMAGVATLTGFPGQTYKLPDYYGDFLPGMFGVISVLTALYYREKTGKGQYIDLSQAECLMRVMHNFTYLSITEKEIGCTGNIDPTMSPSGIFKTKDGKFIALAIATDEQFYKLLEAMNKSSSIINNEKFSKIHERLKPENMEELIRIVEEWVKTKSMEEIIELAKKYGFPASPVMDDWEIFNDEWRRERGSIVTVNDEMYGEAVLPGPVVMLHKTPGRIKWLSRPVGYHNKYVFKKLLGLSDEEIKQLEKEGVIGYWDNKPGLKPPIYYDLKNDKIFNY